ncbi:membrane protein [Desulfosporosinus meridiei]|uniref:ABC-2 family transporter protein n=1 Tax=Desulfosporosinus meridiei (strain ATCC BAA-275 / DSM 13257 / KCTC 12902 / NCIMB 13706 / S10) TaxID=768704 RepID=J7J283_DESMD|nr:membrane protein [Desulfosporosinus meridiei]AFQ45403.1 hypothetical protein Desmer_3563 [Desulfosporosinus meridiei DSM 13257]
MLGKLMKYEIKATGRIFFPLFLALLIFATITRLLSSIGPEAWDTPAVISMVIYGIIMVGMFVMTLLMMIQRFYKNLLSDEGYLMLTLPVKPWQHIVSKLLVSMLWIVASIFTAFISSLVIALKKGDLTKGITEFTALYHRAVQELGSSVYIWSFEIIIMLLISLASGILVIYASIALGHLFNRHKMLATFGAFIVLSTLTQIFFTFLGMVPGATYLSNLHISANDILGMQRIAHLAMVGGIIFNALLCSAYLAITNFILSKRLNLE